MAFVKALCVVLLLYSATFGESRSLQDDNNSEKRAIPPHEMNALAQQIAETLERPGRSSSGPKPKSESAKS